MSESIPEFVGYPKIARLHRDIQIAEKLDGTNAQIFINDAGEIFAGSRSRWLTPGATDNYSFAAWVEGNKAELLKLGPGRHYGEWWGAGIQRRYGQKEKIFSLFRPRSPSPDCCRVVPVLYKGPFSEATISQALRQLATEGSVAAPGFMKPEGIVVYHTAANVSFKITLDNDELPKGAQQ